MSIIEASTDHHAVAVAVAVAVAFPIVVAFVPPTSGKTSGTGVVAFVPLAGGGPGGTGTSHAT
jgi:hypothetical protein